MTELRSCIFIDQLQPQTLAYLASWMRGTLPRARMAAQVIEISPGLDIETLTDVAIKSAVVSAGLLVVERQFGTLEFHSNSTAEVQAAADAVLDSIGASKEDAAKPKILGSKIVTRVDNQHAFLINRNRIGSMVLTGESLYLLECQSASYAILACNEAEKAADINVLEFRAIGAFGRVYLGGSEANIEEAAKAALNALAQIDGRPNEG